MDRSRSPEPGSHSLSDKEAEIELKKLEIQLASMKAKEREDKEKAKEKQRKYKLKLQSNQHEHEERLLYLNLEVIDAEKKKQASDEKVSDANRTASFVSGISTSLQAAVGIAQIWNDYRSTNPSVTSRPTRAIEDREEKSDEEESESESDTPTSKYRGGTRAITKKKHK